MDVCLVSNGQALSAVVVQIGTAQKRMRWKFDAVMRIDALRVKTRASVVWLVLISTSRATLFEQGANSTALRMLVRWELDSVWIEETVKDFISGLL
jgi:mitochondrial fission protein ELM1